MHENLNKFAEIEEEIIGLVFAVNVTRKRQNNVCLEITKIRFIIFYVL